MSETTAEFEAVLERALRLSPVEKARLAERLAATLQEDLAEAQKKKPRRSLYGLWADLNIEITAEDIDEIRREMWGNFPREDIVR